MRAELYQYATVLYSSMHSLRAMAHDTVGHAGMGSAIREIFDSYLAMVHGGHYGHGLGHGLGDDVCVHSCIVPLRFLVVFLAGTGT